MSTVAEKKQETGTKEKWYTKGLTAKEAEKMVKNHQMLIGRIIDLSMNFGEVGEECKYSLGIWLQDGRKITYLVSASELNQLGQILGAEKEYHVKNKSCIEVYFSDDEAVGLSVNRPLMPAYNGNKNRKDQKPEKS